MNRKEAIAVAIKELVSKEGIRNYFAVEERGLMTLLTANLEPILDKLLHDEFVRGYERGKSDERDAIEIDKSLVEEASTVS